VHVFPLASEPRGFFSGLPGGQKITAGSRLEIDDKARHEGIIRQP
jgi:hypothetical protein